MIDVLETRQMLTGPVVSNLSYAELSPVFGQTVADGSVTGEADFSNCYGGGSTIEVDVNNDGTADYTGDTNGQTTFSIAVPITYGQQYTVKVRAIGIDENSSAVNGSWVSFNVNLTPPQNLAPVVINPVVTYDMDNRFILQIEDLLENAVDPENDNVAIVLDSAPSGTATYANVYVMSDHSVRYEPNWSHPDFLALPSTGIDDTFKYRIVDEHGNQSDLIEVQIHISAEIIDAMCSNLCGLFGGSSTPPAWNTLQSKGYPQTLPPAGQVEVFYAQNGGGHCFIAVLDSNGNTTTYSGGPQPGTEILEARSGNYGTKEGYRNSVRFTSVGLGNQETILASMNQTRDAINTAGRQYNIVTQNTCRSAAWAFIRNANLNTPTTVGGYPVGGPGWGRMPDGLE